MNKLDLHTCPGCGFTWRHYATLCRRGDKCAPDDKCYDCHYGLTAEDYSDAPWGEQQGQIDWLERGDVY